MPYNPNSIKELRLSIKLTQERFAAKCGISRQYLNNLEQGKQKPTTDILDKISETFGVDDIYFFTPRLACVQSEGD